MSVATEVLDDAQLAEELALSAIDLALRILGPERAASELDARAVILANAAANAAEDAKFGPAK